MGGQRTQRRKWIHFFDNVDAVIFMLAVNEFDQMLAEDETTVCAFFIRNFYAFYFSFNFFILLF